MQDGARRSWRLVAAEPAAQLATLRVVVPLMILGCPETRHAPRLAAVPPELRVAPEGLGWFVHGVPISPTVASLAQAVCVFSALCAVFGVRARPALIALTLTTFYLFALSQLSGAVWHDMHLLWMVALLAASPCDEALSFDRRSEPRRPNSTRYGWPLFFARLLLGCIYFFPGLHKLHTSGLAWALSDNLRNQLWWKWAEHGIEGPLRVDRMPAVLHACALFALAFELSFPVLALVRRTRPWAVCGGLAFHLLAAVFLRIPFVSLWALYVVLVDPEAIAAWARRTWVRLWDPARAPRLPPPPSPSESCPTAAPAPATLLVGALLVTGAVVQGVRGQMAAYPFACYPTFEWIIGTEMPDLVIEVETVTGERVVVPHARDARGYRTQRQWGEVWSLAGVTGTVDPVRLRAYLASVARNPSTRLLLRRGVRVRVYRAAVSVAPDARDAPARLGPLLLEIPLGS
jgi:hypothetical protein